MLEEWTRKFRLYNDVMMIGVLRESIGTTNVQIMKAPWMQIVIFRRLQCSAWAGVKVAADSLQTVLWQN